MCVSLCTALCVWERESERQHCCICSSLKGANERTCVPPGLVEWGVDEGLAFPSSPIVKTVSRQTGELVPQTLIWQQFGGSSSNDEGDARRRPCWIELWLYLGKKTRFPLQTRTWEEPKKCELHLQFLSGFYLYMSFQTQIVMFLDRKCQYTFTS